MKKGFKFTEENPFQLNKDEQDIVLQYSVNFISPSKADHKKPIFLSTAEEDWEDKLLRADKIIKFLFMNIMLAGEHVIPLGHMYEAAPEIERLYEAMQAHRKGIDIDNITQSKKKKAVCWETVYREAVYNEFNKHADEFQYIKAEHLKLSYNFQGGQVRRDFFGRMFLKYIGTTGLKSPGAQRLYKIYNKMKKYLNRS